jgi:hypothetical protein
MRIAPAREGEARKKKLPAPDLASTGSSFQVVAGVRYEAQERNQARETEAVRVRLAVFGSALTTAGTERPMNPGWHAPA